ncbi:hypothetical protein FNU76_10485 [Chitinimonas arctica]|uniref:ATP-binding protein n=1 Tax=Chitinimonas arctica TaxID=2594795 RepID=A0A516SF18_9NEIS|nr:hypothetical protein [Chitinimonas arctica]QDQ26756.1 hypothetical protein FNU76_10485 [Chitinimonas arctica]
MAQAKGYTCVYVNLWERQANPFEGIAAVVRQRLEQPDPQAGFDTMWHRIDEHKQPILLLIDEAQVLTTSRHTAMSASLRAGLDVRKDAVKIIFTGSGEQTLRTMFGKTSQPFYNWAPIEPFPLLGREFVSYMVATANRALQKTFHLDEEIAQAAFLTLKGSPEVFRRFLECYLTRPDEGAAGAISIANASMFSDEGFAAAWQALPAMDQLILQFVAAGQRAITGKAARTHFGHALGLDDAAPLHAVNNALARLTDPRRHILVKVEHGIYQFEDMEFGQWIQLERPGE